MPPVDELPIKIRISGKAPDSSGNITLVSGDIQGLVTELNDRELVAHKDQPGGYPGIDLTGVVHGRWSILGGTSAQINAVTPYPYELAYVSGEGLRLGDGSVPGGIPLRGRGINVRLRGAKGDGVTDDTAAIQAVYDGLAVGQGVPNNLGGSPLAGEVYFPTGRYRITAPIQVRGCIRTCGESLAASIIDCEAGDGAFRLVASSGVNTNAYAEFENLGVYTTSGHGIFAKIGTNAPAQLSIALRVHRCCFSCRSWGIFLAYPDAYPQDCLITDNDFRGLGAGAIWLDGNFNTLRGNYANSGLGAHWDADRASAPGTAGIWGGAVPGLFCLRGSGLTSQGNHAETGPPGKCPGFYYGPTQQTMGGTNSDLIRHLGCWCESTYDANGYAIVFDSCGTVFCDHLIVDNLVRVVASILQVEALTYDGGQAGTLFSCDATGRVFVGLQRTGVTGQPDWGDPKVSVNRRYNTATGQNTEAFGLDAGANLFPNPHFLRGTYGITGGAFGGAAVALAVADNGTIGRSLSVTISGWTAGAGNQQVTLAGCPRPYGTVGAIPGFWRYRVALAAGQTCALLPNATGDTSEDRTYSGVHCVHTSDITQPAVFVIGGNGVAKISDVEAYATGAGQVVRHPAVVACRAWPSGAAEWTDNAIPTVGTHVAGSIVWNSAPASAGFVGWVCTVGGTPGTWRTFGLIS